MPFPVCFSWFTLLLHLSIAHRKGDLAPNQEIFRENFVPESRIRRKTVAQYGKLRVERQGIMDRSGTHTLEITLPEVDLVVEIDWTAWDAEPRQHDYPGCAAGIAAEDWTLISSDIATKEYAERVFREWAGDMSDPYSNINETLAAEVLRGEDTQARW